MRAAKLQKRAARYGVQTESAADTVAAAAAAVATAPDKARAEQAMGQLLFVAAALARSAGIDPEQALPEMQRCVYHSARRQPRKLRSEPSGTELSAAAFC